LLWDDWLVARTTFSFVQKFVQTFNRLINLLLTRRGLWASGLIWRNWWCSKALKRLAACVGRTTNTNHFKPSSTNASLDPSVDGADVDSLAAPTCGQQPGNLVKRDKLFCSDIDQG
jgi:hypothetical protein